MSTDAPNSDSIAISNNVAESRYEIRVGDELAGFAAYHLRPGKITFTHTEVPPEDEGKGFAARLVGAALADARKRGFKIVPACSYIVAYVRRHPEYDDRV